MIWNQASVNIMDIRHVYMRRGDNLNGFRLPANGFFLTIDGSARVRMDGVEHRTERYHILHGVKGCRLDMQPLEEALELYVVFYNAVLTKPIEQELVELPERSNPFRVQYGMTPAHPKSLVSKLQLMQREWEGQGELVEFHVKAQFYQFAYELLWESHSNGISTAKTDLVRRVKRYLAEHCAESVTMEQLSALFDCSPRHLTRLYKQATGRSPIDYLIGMRMDKAKQLLLTTDATLQEIADSIGYPDSYYFAKMFKRNAGLAPIRYRTANAKRESRSDLPSAAARSVIATRNPQLYMDNENLYPNREEGVATIYMNQTSSFALLR
ncbi:helix-turn-helix domain-containing protein [Cohnella boryungensis]|uniref:Helix-turn-helix domain-containing protein n=2 Tax=Cohnella boryungensis TaxID=768479 RepID=A0ABV8SC89_9BACL